MSNYDVALIQMNGPMGLNSFQTMERFVRAVSNRIQELWVGSVDDKLRFRSDLKFMDLQALVPREARISRITFRKVASISQLYQSMRTPN